MKIAMIRETTLTRPYMFVQTIILTKSKCLSSLIKNLDVVHYMPEGN